MRPSDNSSSEEEKEIPIEFSEHDIEKTIAKDDKGLLKELLKGFNNKSEKKK